MRLAMLATVAILTVLPSFAYAVPIAAGSEISINGSDDFTDTSVTFTGAGNLQGTQGSFNELGTCTGCVTMAASISPGFSGQLFTVTSNGNTATLDLVAPLGFTPGGTVALPDLTVTGSGTLMLSGFDATPGTFELTTQGSSNELNVTFSATAIPTPTAIPEPASLGLLALGLFGLGMVKWRS